MLVNNKFIIKGLNGKKSLKGEVNISGAKNAVLKAMAAAVLFDGEVVLENVPENADVYTMIAIMEKLGADIEWLNNSKDKSDGGRNGLSNNKLKINCSSMNSTDIDMTLANAMRASITLTGPMLARYGKVTFPTPGGCVIGARPIDLSLNNYKGLGATIDENKDNYIIKAKDGLSGAEIFFDKQTVSGTENLLLSAVLAEGKTVLKNCAMEPEIVSIVEWLNDCGADIKGAGTTTIEIQGTGGRLLKARRSYITMPDRIEAGSFLILGALCAENLTLKHCNAEHFWSIINILRDAGVNIEVGKDSHTVSIVNNTKANSAFAVQNFIKTHEYPGFPTDLQAPITTFLTQIDSEVIVFETIYENRFRYVEDLNKMGAKIEILNGREIKVKGPTALNGMTINARDIRAGFAMVMAGLVANGQTEITDVKYIHRGYENLICKFRDIGADIVEAG